MFFFGFGLRTGLSGVRAERSSMLVQARGGLARVGVIQLSVRLPAAPPGIFVCSNVFCPNKLFLVVEMNDAN